MKPARFGALLALSLLGCAGARQRLVTLVYSAPMALPVGAQADGAELLREAGARAEKQGASPLQIAGAEVLGAGGRVGALLQLDARYERRCVVLQGAAVASASAFELEVYDDEGVRRAGAKALRGHARLALCPPHPQRLYVGAQLLRGAGLVAVGLQSVAQDKLAQDRSGVFAPIAAAPSENLSPALHEELTRLGPALELDPPLPFLLEPNLDALRTVTGRSACLGVWLEADETADPNARFDWEIEGDDGVVWARAQASAGQPQTHWHCGGAGRGATVRARAHDELVPLQLRALHAPAVPPSAHEAGVAARRAAWPPAQSELRVSLHDGLSASRSEPELPVAGCSVWSARSESSWQPLQLSLFGPDGQLLREQRGVGEVSALACGVRAGSWRLSAAAGERLDAKLSRHTLNEPLPPAEFVSAYAAARQALWQLGVVTPPRVFALRGRFERALPELPPNGCALLAVAASEASPPPRLSAHRGRDLLSAHAAGASQWVRLCAGKASPRELGVDAYAERGVLLWAPQP